MNEEQLPISVVMPAYNAEKYLGEAIESILNQTFKEFEFIIVDDASTDSTWQIIQRYVQKDSRIVPLRNEKNLRISGTLNRGIQNAKGKYIARMDADDWSYPTRLEEQYAFMQRNSNVVISGTAMEICKTNLEVINTRKYNLSDVSIRQFLFRYSPFCHASTMCKHDSVNKVQGYNQELADAEDYDLYFRLGKYGEFANLPTTLYKVRTHGESMSMIKARRQEKLTLYIRIKAVLEYGYSMPIKDKLYFFAQLVSMFVLPQKAKFWIFNYLRSV